MSLIDFTGECVLFIERTGECVLLIESIGENPVSLTGILERTGEKTPSRTERTGDMELPAS